MLVDKLEPARLVFISTPYKSIVCNPGDRNYIARKIALDACAYIKSKGYRPISPVLSFMGVYNEESEREEVLTSCIELLSVCEYYFFYDCAYSKDSMGMNFEREAAQDMGIKELKF